MSYNFPGLLCVIQHRQRVLGGVNTCVLCVVNVIIDLVDSHLHLYLLKQFLYHTCITVPCLIRAKKKGTRLVHYPSLKDVPKHGKLVNLFPLDGSSWMSHFCLIENWSLFRGS